MLRGLAEENLPSLSCYFCKKLHLNSLHRKVVRGTEKMCVACSERAVGRLVSSTIKCMSMPARDFGIVGVVPSVIIAFRFPIAYAPDIRILSEFVAGHNRYCAFSGRMKTYIG